MSNSCNVTQCHTELSITNEHQFRVTVTVAAEDTVKEDMEKCGITTHGLERLLENTIQATIMRSI